MNNLIRAHRPPPFLWSLAGLTSDPTDPATAAAQARVEEITALLTAAQARGEEPNIQLVQEALVIIRQQMFQKFSEPEGLAKYAGISAALGAGVGHLRKESVGKWAIGGALGGVALRGLKYGALYGILGLAMKAADNVQVSWSTRE